jgi:hypothetical protein
MSDLLLVAPASTESAGGHGELTEAQVLLKQMVLDSVTSPNTRGATPGRWTRCLLLLPAGH